MGVACRTVSSTGNPDAPGDPARPDAAAGPDGVQMLSVDARTVILIGTAAFLLAFLVLLACWSWLGEHQHRVWLWTALAGAVLGVLALPLVGKHTGEGRLG